MYIKYSEALDRCRRVAKSFMTREFTKIAKRSHFEVEQAKKGEA